MHYSKEKRLSIQNISLQTFLVVSVNADLAFVTMSSFIDTTPQILANIVKQITDRLLEKRLQEKTKSYMKIDLNILQQDGFFTIQVTKCSCGTTNFKSLLEDVLKNQLNSENYHQKTIATVYEKTLNGVKQHNIGFNKNLSLSLVTDKVFQEQKDLSLYKCYSSINLLFQVKNDHIQTFRSLLLPHIKQMERTHPNIKLLFRQGEQCIHRSLTRMDDIILSCMIVKSYCANIFDSSLKNSYRKKVINELGIRKSRTFGDVVGWLLLSQTNNNFSDPIETPKYAS